MKILVRNKKVGFNYFIEKTFEAGIELEGWEVKSLISNRGNLIDSFVKVINNELFIVGFNIQDLTSTSSHKQIENNRFKKLLMKRKEIDHLNGLVSIKGYTLMCSEIYYNENGKIKAKVCLCKGKKNFDKREAIKEREVNRNLERKYKL